MNSLGIPDIKENRNVLKANIDTTTNYFENTIGFKKMALPYSDKLN